MIKTTVQCDSIKRVLLIYFELMQKPGEDEILAMKDQEGTVLTATVKNEKLPPKVVLEKGSDTQHVDKKTHSQKCRKNNLHVEQHLSKT